MALSRLLGSLKNHGQIDCHLDFVRNETLEISKISLIMPFVRVIPSLRFSYVGYDFGLVRSSHRFCQLLFSPSHFFNVFFSCQIGTIEPEFHNTPFYDHLSYMTSFSGTDNLQLKYTCRKRPPVKRDQRPIFSGQNKKFYLSRATTAN